MFIIFILSTRYLLKFFKKTTQKEQPDPLLNKIKSCIKKPFSNCINIQYLLILYTYKNFLNIILGRVNTSFIFYKNIIADLVYPATNSLNREFQKRFFSPYILLKDLIIKPPIFLFKALYFLYKVINFIFIFIKVLISTVCSNLIAYTFRYLLFAVLEPFKTFSTFLYTTYYNRT